MRKQTIEPGQRIVHNLNLSLRRRFQLRQHCGPYYGTPPEAGKQESRMFYFASDFAPGLRWEWCDEVAPVISHSGWYCDQFCDETIRGVVFRLPHGRGFLAGWSMGEGMSSEIDVSYIYDDESSAAYAADSMAQYAAERQREFEAESDDE